MGKVLRRWIRWTPGLWAQPNFLSAFGTALDVGGMAGPRTRLRSDAEAFAIDRAAIGSDWLQTGDDLREAMRQTGPRG